MRLSVIVPTYRRPPLLNRCLDALLAQTLPPQDFEIIVVDDGNDDATRATVEVRAGNSAVVIRYLGQPERRGPAAARNRGWRAAKAAVIAFTDDDCLPAPDWLQNARQAIRKGARVVTGQVRVPLPDAPTFHERTTALLETAEFVTANCVCRRSSLEEVGGFDEAFGIAWREDSDLGFRFLEKGISITHQPDVIVVHPVREAPWWAPLKDEAKNRYDALLFKRHPRLFRERIPRYAGLVGQYYATVLSFLGGVVALLAGAPRLGLGLAVIWLLLVTALVVRHVRGTNKRLTFGQTLLTALVTPFLSVYWRLYGAVTHRVAFF